MNTTKLRREQGFTLIELLVVMIIISILMAVAVPTYLSQKNTALKTQATANIKNVVNAIESCASQITTGGYVDQQDNTMNCTKSDVLVGYEKSLSNLNITDQAIQPVASNTNKTRIILDGSEQGYLVERMIMDSGKFVYFAEIHTADGNLLKLCSSGSGHSMASTTGVKDPATKTCKTGTW